MSDIDDLIAARSADWIALRRDLHRHPELGFTEYRTISRLATRLAALGYDIRLGEEVLRRDAMIGVPDRATIDAARDRALPAGADPGHVTRMGEGMTALVGELRRGPGPVVAMRFDVDALPILEEDTQGHLPHRLGFASVHPGAMHACAHDGHATIGIGLAEAAARPDARWHGTLRLIFQPAEEGGRGARPMVEAGVVDDADWFFALHLGCDLPSGKVACEAAEMMFSAKWDVTFRGLAAHAAGNPENGHNALLAAAQATIGLYALPRHGRYLTHVNVGRLEGGSARNVIADRASMQIELRGSSDAALAHMVARGRTMLEGIAAANGCEIAIEEMGLTVGADASPEAAARIGAVAQGLRGIDDVLERWPLGGGDDAAFFVRRVQERGGHAAYMVLGSDLAAGHHAINFDFDEADIATGVRLMTGLLESVGQEGNSRGEGNAA